MRQHDPNTRPQPEPAPDLQTQLEALLDQVWRCEADWRFDDRLQLSLATMRPHEGDSAA